MKFCEQSGVPVEQCVGCQAEEELSHVERFGTTDAGFEERILDAEMAAGEPSDVHPPPGDRRGSRRGG